VGCTKEKSMAFFKAVGFSEGIWELGLFLEKEEGKGT
jgi:hypothetical protein